MLKVFRFTQGWLDYYGAYKDLEEAYARRAEIDHTFHYTDVRIEEIQIDGYLVRAYPDIETLPFADLSEEEEAYIPVPSEPDFIGPPKPPEVLKSAARAPAQPKPKQRARAPHANKKG